MVFSLSIIGSIPATTSSVNHLRCEMPKCSQIWNLKWRLVFRKQVALQPPHVWESFLNKLYAPKVVVPNVPKGNVFVKLPFLGNTSFQIRKKLQQLFSDKLTSCNLKIVFTSPVRVKSFFIFKYKLPQMLLSGLVYQCKCCNATYYGKTKRHFNVQICEHLGISHLAEKKVKIDNNKLTAIQEHLLCCN